MAAFTTESSEDLVSLPYAKAMTTEAEYLHRALVHRRRIGSQSQQVMSEFKFRIQFTTSLHGLDAFREFRSRPEQVAWRCA